MDLMLGKHRDQLCKKRLEMHLLSIACDQMKSPTSTADTVNVQATDKEKKKLPIPMLVGGILLLLGGGIWAMSGDSDTVDQLEDTVGVVTPEVPVVPKVPVVK